MASTSYRRVPPGVRETVIKPFSSHKRRVEMCTPSLCEARPAFTRTMETSDSHSDLKISG